LRSLTWLAWALRRRSASARERVPRAAVLNPLSLLYWQWKRRGHRRSTPRPVRTQAAVTVVAALVGVARVSSAPART